MSEPEFVTFRMANSAHGGTIASVAERIGGVLFTRRRANWLRGYLQALAEGATGDVAAIRGGRIAGIGALRRRKPLSDLAVQAKMDAFLALPDTKAAMRGIYQEGADFSLTDAVALHKKHIEGFPVEQESVDKNGQVVQYTQTIPPSWPALKDYLDRTTPKEPGRLILGRTNLDRTQPQRTDGSPPPMSSRPIGETYEHDG